MFEEKILKNLVKNGKILPNEAEVIVKSALEKQISISKILLDQKIISEDIFFQELASELNLQYFNIITDSMIDPMLLVKFPFKFLRKASAIPIVVDGQTIVLTQDPRDVELLDDFQMAFKKSVLHAVAPKTVIQEAVNKFYPFNTGQETVDELKDSAQEEAQFDMETGVQDLLEMSNDAPIVKLVNHIIFQAVKEGASDIHIEPFEKEIVVRYRIDGVMYSKTPVPPRRYHEAIISRIKIIGNLNIAEKRNPQGGRIQVRVADKMIDLRISILPCNYGERVSMRILDKSRGVTELESLGLSNRDLTVFNNALSRPHGIILVSGPTGSGKTTTLYSALKALNKPEVNIITVEDPVEYTMHGIGQVQVNEKAGLTFASALREILRQDPDIVLIGEIRDPVTAQIATQAALTGHLVLSTIHTNSAPATITRLIDMGIESFLIASSLVCVIAQRLVRALCQKCKQPYQPEADLLSKAGFAVNNNARFFKAVGCHECGSTGYKGRLAVFEIMEVDEKLATLIVKNPDLAIIKKSAVESGMTSLSIDGMRKAELGLTTIEEVLTVAFHQASDKV